MLSAQVKRRIARNKARRQPFTRQVSRFQRDVQAVRRQSGDPHLAVVGKIGDQVVMDDPVAVAMIQTVGKHNCKRMFELNADRVAHFKQRISDRGMSPSDALIVLINVDDPNGGRLAASLMPGHSWQEYRDRGETPIARGLAMRPGIDEVIGDFDKAAADKLKAMTGVAVVIVDHGVAEVFPA